jgi:hypothetical protein
VDLGFETIGNATLICHDRGPVLATDPWIVGDPYFGSWTMSHEIPDEQLAAIRSCPFVWISHGHPDHLSFASLRELAGARILVPDHVGGRVARAIADDGHAVTVLTSGSWCRLSDRIRVLSIADYNQDAVLLVELGDRLIVNLNDAADKGWGPAVKRAVRDHPVSILMRLSGFGDADMINLFDESGARITPAAATRRPIGAVISRWNDDYGTRFFVPFSSMHRYQRADSIWADAYVTRPEDHAHGFESSRSELLPAFVRFDALRDHFEPIEPPERDIVVRDPQEYGDDWDEPLEPSDQVAISAYFRAISHLERHFDFIRVRVGGDEHVVSLSSRGFDRGITFEAPRHSFMAGIRHEVFDDLLIGNFMRTTLHGTPPPSLYPDFTPFVGKYADNGLARTPEELRAYFNAYSRRAPFDFLRHRIERRAMTVFRSRFAEGSPLDRAARRGYRRIRATAGRAR